MGFTDQTKENKELAKQGELFSEKYEVPWGPLGYVVFKRTYARRLRDSINSPTEEFEQTIDRIIKACRTQLNVGFTPMEEDELKTIFMKLKGLVAGRFLWQLGTKTVDKLGMFSLQNCAFVVVDSPIRPFTWAMDALMLGSGVGYNIQRENVYQLTLVKKAKIVRLDTNDADFIVPDSREGWVALLDKVLTAHFVTGKGFSYSTVCIRGKGAPIKGFGGVASGPEELCWGMQEINKVLNARAGKRIRPIDALDIMNIIGYVVVSGNVRRSAQIAIGDMDDLQFINAKRWDLGNIPNWRAMSNNSVVCNDINLLPEQIWEGYKGNGEPYGFINLGLARSIGRTGETQYPDPEVQGFNPCVTKDTWITTSKGPKQVEELIGQAFTAVVDGINCESGPSGFYPTGTQKVFNLTTKEGFSLRLTEAHRVCLENGEWIEAKDLIKGQKIRLNNHSNTIPNLVSGSIGEATGYLLGLLIGDGCIVGDKAVLSTWLENGSQGIRDAVTNYTELFQKRADFTGWHKLEDRNEYRLSFKSFDNIVRSYGLSQGNKVINKAIEMDKQIAPTLIKGLFDSDGCVLGSQNKGVSIRLCQVNLDNLRAVQRILARMGIISTIYKNRRQEGFRELPNGKGSVQRYFCQATHELVIANENIIRYNQLIGFFDTDKQAKIDEAIINYQRQPNKESFTATFESLVFDKDEDVYDVEIQDVHAFDANGLYVHNCAEQSLANFETCCLAEIILPNIESKKELSKVAKYLYRINKHSLKLPSHAPETEAIVHKNMRMGIGISGYLESSETKKNWLSSVYEELREYDKEYSAAHGWPISIKLTTVKPSGTLSLLPGVTPGAHPGIYQYFIRRVTMASNIDLVDVCRKNGFPVEYKRNFDRTDDFNSVVVSFPCKYPDGTKLANEMTAIDQLEVISRLQREWSDNSVSVTVYYKKEELPAIQEWLKANFNDNLKTVSFLLHSDHGFDQVPYEEITKEQYEALSASTKPIRSIEVSENDVSGVDECAGGMCPIK